MPDLRMRTFWNIGLLTNAHRTERVHEGRVCVARSRKTGNCELCRRIVRAALDAHVEEGRRPLQANHQQKSLPSLWMGRQILYRTRERHAGLTCYRRDALLRRHHWKQRTSYPDKEIRLPHDRKRPKNRKTTEVRLVCLVCLV